MAVQISTTKGAHANGVKMLVYGRSGSGKTTLAKTLPDPIIISAEAGILSLSDVDIPVITVNDIDGIRDAFAYVRDASHKSIVLDSISEIAEVVLAAEKKTAKDPRQAYGAMQESITALVRSFRDIPGKHVVVIAKQEKIQDDTGHLIYGPSMPGKQLGPALPYFFDEVFCLRTKREDDGSIKRALQTGADDQYDAKDRSGKLDFYEVADLGAIIRKVEK